MAEYKLLRALPQSAHGSEEMHYGRMCKVRNNCVYIDLTEDEAKNWVRGTPPFIEGPIIPDAPAKEDVPPVENKEPKKRGPKPKVGKVDNSPDNVDKVDNK